jgi:hypothetical protein
LVLEATLIALTLALGAWLVVLARQTAPP